MTAAMRPDKIIPFHSKTCVMLSLEEWDHQTVWVTVNLELRNYEKLNLTLQNTKCMKLRMTLILKITSKITSTAAASIIQVNNSKAM